MAYSRSDSKENIIVAFNVSNEEQVIELPLSKKPNILFGKPMIAGNQITIPPRSGIVVK
jgi:hypothetical protein